MGYKEIYKITNKIEMKKNVANRVFTSIGCVGGSLLHSLRSFRKPLHSQPTEVSTWKRNWTKFWL
jgi:hypothetical protein